jgi:hypothetical protein
MQIDFDAFEFARTGNWIDPAANIRFGCQVLAESRDFIQRKAHLEGRALLQAAIAAYRAYRRYHRTAHRMIAASQGRYVNRAGSCMAGLR